MKVENNYKSDEYLNTLHPIEVVVNRSIDEAIGRLRAMITKERIMSDLKEHSSYEKPSEKKRRKHRESIARQHKADAMQRAYNSNNVIDEFDNLP